MTDKELKFISYNGINPCDPERKEIFQKLVEEYKTAFEKKFGKPTLIDGIEIYAYRNEYFIYCKPFANGQYSRSFRFGADNESDEEFGKYGEYAYAHTQVEIPCAMCTTETAKIFPVKKVSFKIKDGKVTPVVSKTTSLLNSGKTYDLYGDEKVWIHDDLLMASSDGLTHIQTGDLLYSCDGVYIHFTGNEVSMRDPASCSGARVSVPLEDVYSKIEDRIDDNRKLAKFGLTCSDFKDICQRMGKVKINYSARGLEGMER